MKRIIISVIILVLCVSGALFEVFSVSRSVDSCIESIEEIDSLVDGGDYAAAEEKCVMLENRWHKISRAIDAVLIHDYVDRIKISIAEMKSYIRGEAYDSYLAAGEGAKRALASVKDSEYPTLENIL